MPTLTKRRNLPGRNGATAPPPADVPALCVALRDLQRQRAILIKSRNMQANRLRAIVAGFLGYESRLAEAERQKKFREAQALIDAIDAGTDDGSLQIRMVVKTTLLGINAFEEHKADLERQILKTVRQLPAAAWVGEPAQRGFGLPFLAVVVGETGDLAGYANPAKVWRRMGCAPWTFDDKTRMGATWRSGREGKLPAAEWEAFGYNPRRRSIAYLIGGGLVKQNGGCEADGDKAAREPGPYRLRYDAAKVRARETHPEWDWKPCTECRGEGKVGRRPCNPCAGLGEKCMRAHLHGMLLATKLLLKNLWVEWNGKPEEDPGWQARAASRGG